MSDGSIRDSVWVRKVTTENLERLARALGCTPDPWPCECVELKRKCLCAGEWRHRLQNAIDDTLRAEEYHAQEAARLARKQELDAERVVPEERWSDIDAALTAAAEAT